MISTLTSSDASDPLVRFLMLTEEERERAIVPIDALIKTQSRGCIEECLVSFRGTN